METAVKSFKLAEKMLSTTVDVKMSVTTEDNIKGVMKLFDATF